MHKIFLVLFPAFAWAVSKKSKKAMKKTAFNIELKISNNCKLSVLKIKADIP